MTELFTMILLAANMIVASAFAKFVSMVAADAAVTHEQTSDIETFEGRVVARIRARAQSRGTSARTRDRRSSKPD
jgi:hypothetical protein